MILAFPSTVLYAHITKPIDRGTQAQLFHLIGACSPVDITSLIVLTAPINLKPKDIVFFDIRDRSVELVMRGGIMIWRAAWKN